MFLQNYLSLIWIHDHGEYFDAMITKHLFFFFKEKKG